MADDVCPYLWYIIVEELGLSSDMTLEPDGSLMAYIAPLFVDQN